MKPKNESEIGKGGNKCGERGNMGEGKRRGKVVIREKSFLPFSGIIVTQVLSHTKC